MIIIIMIIIIIKIIIIIIQICSGRNDNIRKKGKSCTPGLELTAPIRDSAVWTGVLRLKPAIKPSFFRMAWWRGG